MESSSNLLTLWKGKTMKTVKRSVKKKITKIRGEWEWTGGAQRIFTGVKQIHGYYNGGHVNTHLAEATGCPTVNVNLNVDYTLQVIMIHQCKFTSCNRGTTLVPDDDWGGWYMEALCTFGCFSVNIKLFKNSLFKKKTRVEWGPD